ncbi:DNA (cytosine-5-)-methyltransferase [Catellatospora sp. IY07-71]|uniref:DNA cytosine methyltransferase n=1 Tax=Catellatospora sp. IY07-71 TaxID=2728827 RepID=UPI001BB41CA3|nr:DNA cytosine methyltransferase [Catellatospora sp. IY07-71]BCJ70677.1 DNA (cytosine-5-)-methyltransferase [Catellatospora sp. IY07-71]
MTPVIAPVSERPAEVAPPSEPGDTIVAHPVPPATVAEFFAGIGLVRMGLERVGFRVVWANDIEPDKKQMYSAHFQDPDDDGFHLGDVAEVHAEALPTDLSLAWASFPCTDLSLAGGRSGLAGKHSGTFWHFTRILEELGESAPAVVTLENVTGLATSHGGADMKAAITSLNELGYSVDVLTIDARRFVPQSRPRLFIIGLRIPPAEKQEDNYDLRPKLLDRFFNDTELVMHRAVLPVPPALRDEGLSEIAEDLEESDPRWWDDKRTAKFFDELSPLNQARLELLKASEKPAYRTAYRRTRLGKPAWEIRPDDVAGCLRTARGGSSKQAVVRAEAGRFKVRWMTSVEYARLMGADTYTLGNDLRVSHAVGGFGDAVCVPAVEWLARHYLMPMVQAARVNSSSPETV